MRTEVSWLLVPLLVGCATNPPPASVERAEAASESPAMAEARLRVPEAVGRADQLRSEARTLLEAGNKPESALVAEQAEVAYRMALVLAERTTAETRRKSAEEEVRKAERELAELEAEQQRLTADADAFERKALVLANLETPSDVEKMSVERQIARRKAALELTSEARALCLVAKVLDGGNERLSSLDAETTKLWDELAVGANQKDVYPRATRLRNDCLTVLTAIRRPETQKAPEEGRPDRLLRALSETGQFFALRDDRGIVVTLRSNELGDRAFSPETVERLGLLANVAKEHRDFPLLVVAHGAKKGDDKAARRDLERVRTALLEAGAPRVETLLAGYAEPVVSPKLPGSEARNARVEIVFMAPTL